jgi:hypothetical protein
MINWDSFKYQPPINTVAEPKKISTRDFFNRPNRLTQTNFICNYHERDLSQSSVGTCRNHASHEFWADIIIENNVQNKRIRVCHEHYLRFQQLRNKPGRNAVASHWYKEMNMLQNFLPYEDTQFTHITQEAKQSTNGLLSQRITQRVGKKKLNSTIRTKCWQLYASQFIRLFMDDKWFQLNNPRDQPFTVIRCWCCGEQSITHHGYTNRYNDRSPTFECGHVYAQSETGNDDISNLRPICSDCNKKQGTQSMYDFARACHYHTNRYSLICIEQ